MSEDNWNDDADGANDTASSEDETDTNISDYEGIDDERKAGAGKVKPEKARAGKVKTEKTKAGKTKPEKAKAGKVKTEKAKDKKVKTEKAKTGKDKKTIPSIKSNKSTHPYLSVDIKFIDSNKKVIVDIFHNMITQNIKITRPTNDKNASIDANAKNQLMYLMHRVINIGSRMKDTPPNIQGIREWIEGTFKTSDTDYMLYRYLLGITSHMKYDMTATDLEESILLIISIIIVDEDLAQHLCELFILSMKRLATVMSCVSVYSTKRISSDRFNEFMRCIDLNNTNPEIFNEVYGYVGFRKSLK